ncbi:MAG: hypothetical protein MUE83_12520 [Tabrizicola sp.]|jgi:hypothetical protein|nr:hypothetical protein [Tabrizicola sp.]
MPDQITIACLCGRCRITLSGHPILSAECHCESCRRAADAMEALPGAPKERSAAGGVPYVLWRKDRVGRIEGEELMIAYRLTRDAKTRRVVATCCNAPMFLEFSSGHWLSLNAARFPADQRPAMELRTMTGDRVDPAPLPGDIPNARTHFGAGFMRRLLGAWIAMGFRNPRVLPNVKETTHA